MKETTKPNTEQLHLLKRDLVTVIAALPLPTPIARARGEGCGFAQANFETRNSKPEIQETSSIEGCGSSMATVQTMKADLDCSSRRKEAPSDRSSIAGNKMEPPCVGCYVNHEFELSPIDLQFPQFMDIAARRDEPLPLFASVNTNPDNRIPINKRMI